MRVFKCKEHIVNEKNDLKIMVDDIDPHTIGITESSANKDISDAELGLTGYMQCSGEFE